jgi:hypothetical protein
MALTGKQEAFCQAVADGMTQSDAYRHAYSAEKMKPISINVNASKLMSDTNISLRVKELKDALSQKALWTREQSVSELVDIASLSKEAGQFGAATGAIKELNAMHGYNEAVKVELKGGITSIVRTIIDPKNDAATDD